MGIWRVPNSDHQGIQVFFPGARVTALNAVTDAILVDFGPGGNIRHLCGLESLCAAPALLSENGTDALGDRGFGMKKPGHGPG